MTRYCWRCGSVLAAVPPTACAVCGEVHYPNPKPRADAIVVRDGQVLLVLRARDPDANTWDVPGGFCEADEHPMAAAERELHEETGLRARAVAYVGTWIDRYGPPDEDGLEIFTAVSGYLAELTQAPPATLSSPDLAETLEIRWFPLDALPERLAFPAHTTQMLAAAAELVRSGGAQPIFDRPPGRDYLL